MLRTSSTGAGPSPARQAGISGPASNPSEARFCTRLHSSTEGYVATMTNHSPRHRRARGFLAASACLAMVAAGCGARLSKSELQNASSAGNGASTGAAAGELTPGDQTAATDAGATAGASAAPAAGSTATTAAPAGGQAAASTKKGTTATTAARAGAAAAGG